MPSPRPNANHQTSPSLEGALLLSTPLINNGIFQKSVIFLTQHNSSGAKGFLLNHPLSKKVGSLLSDSEAPLLKDLPIHLGGPVSRDLLSFASFSWDPERQRHHFHPPISAAESIGLLNRPNTHLRAFLGYAEWGPQQIEHEISHQNWVILPSSAHTFALPSSAHLWTFLLTQAGANYELIARMPDHPILN